MDSPVTSPASFQGPDRQALLALLGRQVDTFEKRSRLGKLTAHPWRMIVSESSKRFRRPVYTTVDTFWGARMNITMPEPVSTFLYRYRYFEKELSTLLLKVLKSGDCFMDIGSHYGYFSLLAAHLVGSGGAVIAFEPTPRTYKILASNIAPYAQVHAENLAAWSEPKTLEITDLGMEWSSHNSLLAPKMIPNGAEKRASKHRIKAIRIDDYIFERELKPALIKIDAESAELAILQGMTRTLTEIRPIISIEVGDNDGDGSPVRSTDAVRHCASFGYEALAFENGRIVPHVIKERYGYDNIFMFPRGKRLDDN